MTREAGLAAALADATRACFQAMPQCVQVFTPDGLLVFINTAGVAALEIDQPEMLYGMHWEEVWPEGPRDQLHCGVKRALRGTGETFLSFCSTMKGNPRWWEKTISPLHDAHGVISHILWIAHDVTAYKHTIQAQRAEIAHGKAMLQSVATQLAVESRRLADSQARVRQEAKTRLLGGFVGTVVHDINNVLSVLNAAFSMLPRHAVPGVSGEVVGAGQDAIARGGRLVRQLLDFAREDPPGMTTVRVSKMVEANRPMLEALAGSRIRLLTSMGDADDWPVTAIPGTIEGVVFNLVANARDAMPEGGIIEIKVSKAGPYDLPTGMTGEYVVLAVSDTGCGMSPEILAKAGRPFFTTKPRGSGTGLGLASAFELAESSSGRVVLTSTEGQGTTVTLYLSRAGVRDGAPAPDGEGLARLHGAATILFVDRDDGARKMLAERLRALHYVVIEAASTEMAVGVAGSDLPIDLVIHDMDTGRDAGFQLGEQLRRDRPGVPVITLRNATEPTPQLGEVWLRKPIYEPLLVRTVLEQLGRLPAVMMTPAMLQVSERLRSRLSNRLLREMFDNWYGISRSLARLPVSGQHPELDQMALSPQAYLVEVSETDLGTQFRLRQIGADLTARLGQDLTDSIVTSSEEALLGTQRAAYERCRRGYAHFDYARMRLDDRAALLFERLLVPLSLDGIGVTHMLGMVSITTVERRR